MEENKQALLTENERKSNMVEESLEKSRSLLERCKQAINRANEANERWQKQLRDCAPLTWAKE